MNSIVIRAATKAHGMARWLLLRDTGGVFASRANVVLDECRCMRASGVHSLDDDTLVEEIAIMLVDTAIRVVGKPLP